MSNGQYIGKFRGIVTDNDDPETRGRIRARVPDVYGDDKSGWALPAVPYAGRNVGMYFVPPVNAQVWIEFEHGDPEYPVWSGCFWAEQENPALQVASSPAASTLPNTKVLKTDNCTLMLDDTSGSGGITIEMTGGIKITLKSEAIEINNGKGAVIKLSGIQVSVNDGALEVM
jgi:uncharacterized protein involved in type VI secretion and phage assembly